MRRGEVWWADLRKPVGRRPVLLLSRDSAYRVRRSVTVAPLTRTERRIPTEVALDRSDGVGRAAQCVVNLDDIATIPRSLLSERITLLNADRMRAVAGAITFALDLP